ncbi:MAG: OsmC family protein [Thermoplasmatota archaeon]
MIESATAVPTSAVSANIAARHHTMVQDKPPASGGTDRGPMASELLLGGLLACQLSTLVKVAAKRRMEVEVVELQGDMVFDDKSDIERVDLHFQLRTQAPAKKVETLLRLTDQACTISRALSVPVQATFTILA